MHKAGGQEQAACILPRSVWPLATLPGAWKVAECLRERQGDGQYGHEWFREEQLMNLGVGAELGQGGERESNWVILL